MRFSIVIPAYNAEKEIKRTIESTLNQTYDDYEIIVINDASTDTTKEKVVEFEKVRLINNDENIKAGGSRNRGIEAANGEYIVFVDSDDILTSNDVLEKLASHIDEKGHTDIVYIGMNSSDGERSLIPDESCLDKINRITKWKYANVIGICWKKEFLEKNNIKFVEKRFFEDFLFYYEGVIKAETYSVAKFPVVTYTRGRSDSMTTKFNMQKIEDFYSNMTLLTKLYMEVEDKYKSALFEAILRQHKNIEYYMLNMKRTD